MIGLQGSLIIFPVRLRLPRNLTQLLCFTPFYLKGMVIYMTQKIENQDVLNQEAIPDDVVDTLARCLFPKIQEYFKSPEGQAEFEEWKRRKPPA